MTSKNENSLSFDQISSLRNLMTLDFGTGPLVLSKVEIYLEEIRLVSTQLIFLGVTFHSPSSTLLFRSILRFGSTVTTKDWKKKEGVEVWNEIPPRILDEIVYFHPNEMNEIAREKSSRSDDLPYRVTYPHVSNKGKSISFIKEKRFYSCAKNATFSIYIFVLNDRFIQCPFAIYFISYTGHFSVFHERKHLFAFQTSSSQSIKRLLPCPPSPVPRKAATSRANSI